VFLILCSILFFSYALGGLAFALGETQMNPSEALQG